MGLTLPPGFEWSLLTAVLTGVVCFLQGFPIGRLRAKLFDKDFYAKPALKDFPKEAINSEGYPEMGQGRLADLLDWNDWLRFNNAQRAHYNFLEVITFLVTLQLVTAVFFPKLAFFGGVAMIVGRQAFAMGYRSRKGARGRLIGAALTDIAILVMLVASIYGIFNAGGGVDGFVNFIKS